MQIDTRYGLVAALGAPAAIVARIEAAVAKALDSREVREQYATLGLDPAAMNPADYASYLRGEIARRRKVVAAATLTPQ